MKLLFSNTGQQAAHDCDLREDLPRDILPRDIFQTVA